MNTVQNKRIIMVVLGLLCFFYNCPAQEKPYYWDVTGSTISQPVELVSPWLHVQYADVYGHAAFINLALFDWKRLPVAVIRLDKSYGLNNYTIDLRQFVKELSTNAVYMGELVDEAGKKYQLPIKLSLPEVPPPGIDIIIDPSRVECSGINASLADFYAQISGGRAPYTLEWYVLNSTGTELLYQPREDVMAEPGRSSSITVDAQPEYSVALFVKDACNSMVKKMVTLSCSRNKKKFNTLFVENFAIDEAKPFGKEIR